MVIGCLFIFFTIQFTILILHLQGWTNSDFMLWGSIRGCNGNFLCYNSQPVTFSQHSHHFRHLTGVFLISSMQTQPDHQQSLVGGGGGGFTLYKSCVPQVKRPLILVTLACSYAGLGDKKTTLSKPWMLLKSNT